MSFHRRSFRRRRPSGRHFVSTGRHLRYSQEAGTFWVQVQDVGGENSAVSVNIVSPSTVMGIRKAKNFRLDLLSDSDAPVFWALLFIPEGISTTPHLNIGNTNNVSIYEPNQNVIMFGVVDSTCPSHQFTGLARNVTGGDCIILTVQNCTAKTANIRGAIGFVIAYG